MIAMESRESTLNLELSQKQAAEKTYKVELKQSLELSNIQRAHLQNSEHEYQKQIQHFEHHMSLNLVAPKQQESFQMELTQQQ